MVYRQKQAGEEYFELPTIIVDDSLYAQIIQRKNALGHKEMAEFVIHCIEQEIKRSTMSEGVLLADGTHVTVQDGRLNVTDHVCVDFNDDDKCEYCDKPTERKPNDTM